MEIQFFHLTIKIIQVTTITIFSNIACLLVSLLNAALTHLGIFKSPIDSDDHNSCSGSHVTIISGSSPFLLRVPVPVVIVIIKNKVSIIPYSETAHPCDNTMCMLCLEFVDGDHMIRELVNCEHVFHLECLDACLDVGHVHCPLCRSLMLPKKLVSLVTDTVAVNRLD